MVEYARRCKTTSKFDFDNSVLQTKGILQGTALSLRLDVALLADFLSLKQRSPGTSQTRVILELDRTVEDCHELIRTTTNGNRLLQQTEGYIFLAQVYALERSQSPPEVAEELSQHCRAALDQAQSLCDARPAQTRGLAEEIDGVKKMLDGATFYTAVTSEERMAVIQAMAREFRGTGHWYHCPNGHPFTIGECGGAMQLATCPECGAPVGGQNHRTVEGVTRATDLERDFAQLRL
jgi:hypothetical protein